MDRSDIAEVWLQRYEEKVTVIKNQLADSIRKDKLVVLKFCGEELQVLGPRSIASVFTLICKWMVPKELKLIGNGEQ